MVAKTNTRDYGKRHPRFRYQEGGAVELPDPDVGPLPEQVGQGGVGPTAAQVGPTKTGAPKKGRALTGYLVPPKAPPSS